MKLQFKYFNINKVYRISILQLLIENYYYYGIFYSPFFIIESFESNILYVLNEILVPRMKGQLLQHFDESKTEKEFDSQIPTFSLKLFATPFHSFSARTTSRHYVDYAAVKIRVKIKISYVMLTKFMTILNTPKLFLYKINLQYCSSISLVKYI